MSTNYDPYGRHTRSAVPATSSSIDTDPTEHEINGAVSDSISPESYVAQPTLHIATENSQEIHSRSQSFCQSPTGPLTKMALVEGEMCSGPMWIAAATEANAALASKRAMRKPPKADAQLSLLAKTRQRAEVSSSVAGAEYSANDGYALLNKSSILRDQYSASDLGTHIQRNDTANALLEPPLPDASAPVYSDDIYDMAMMKTKVAPLLLTGVLGIIGGFFASIYVQSSCDFFTAMVYIQGLGGGVTNYPFHFGMWKYTPIDSVYKGYSYCDGYDEDYEAPNAPRVCGVIALLLGFQSLVVLWVYLIMGKTSELVWEAAIYSLYSAAFFSSLMLLVFRSAICQSSLCIMGPSSFISILTTIVWLLLAYVMRQNAPAAVRINAAIRAKAMQSTKRSNVPTSVRKNGNYKGNLPSRGATFSSGEYRPPEFV